MKISQLNFSYSPLEDRLLFRFNTLDKCEFRMWLTRAMSIKLVGLLRQLVRTDLRRERPEMGGMALQTVGEFRREAVLAKADYAQSYFADAESFPIGPQPVLVTDIVMGSADRASTATFHLAIGQGVILSLDHDFGVAIDKLLSDVMDTLDWGWGMAKELPVAGIDGSGEKMMLH